MPEGAEEGILRGMYLLREAAGTAQVQLLGSGTILREVLAAADLLADDFGVEADVWSVHVVHRAAPRRAWRPSAGTACTRPRQPRALVRRAVARRARRARSSPRPTTSARSPDQIRAVGRRARTACSAPTASAAATTASALRRFFEVDRHHVARRRAARARPTTSDAREGDRDATASTPERRPRGGGDAGHGPGHRRLRRRTGDRGPRRAGRQRRAPRTRWSRWSPTRRRWRSPRRSAGVVERAAGRGRRQGLRGHADRSRSTAAGRRGAPARGGGARGASRRRRRARTRRGRGRRDAERRGRRRPQAPAARPPGGAAPADARRGPSTRARPCAGWRASSASTSRSVEGTGRKGRITTEDLDAAPPARPAAGAAGRRRPGPRLRRGRRSTSTRSARSSACRSPRIQKISGAEPARATG